jgi:hypothetical protein
LAALVVVLGVLVATKKSSPPPLASAEPAKVAAPAEPARPDTRAETHVLEPAPATSLIPSPAPAAPAPAAEAKPEKAAPARGEPAKAEPAKAEAAPKTEPAKSALPPATLVFAVQPWGEIYVNGKARGVTPPMKSLKLDPGKYKVEIRNTTFPPHTESFDLKARDEVTVRHKFQ